MFHEWKREEVTRGYDGGAEWVLYRFHSPVGHPGARSLALNYGMGHCSGETITDHSSIAEASSHLFPKLFQNSTVIFLIIDLTLRNPFNMNELMEVRERFIFKLFISFEKSVK